MSLPVSFRAILLLSLLGLGACDTPVARSVPAPAPAAPVAADTSTTPVPSKAPAATPTAPASPAPVADKPVANQPMPSRPNELPTMPPAAGRSCATDSDCAIKDAGSCCGMRPVCVHKDTPTFPEQVKAKCAEDGRVGICGFPAISGCQCVAGTCEGVPMMENTMENGLQVQ